MKNKIYFNSSLVLILIVSTLFSCQNKENIISSYSLNKADGIYKVKEEPFTGKVLDTSRSGRVLLTFNCINGKLEGEYLEYFIENGNLNQRSTYKNGEKTGPYIKLTKNGDSISYGNYINSKKNGEWKEFYNNGKLKYVGEYENDLQVGLWKYYHYQGKLKASGTYKNGNETNLGKTNIPINGRQGLWQFYSEDTGEVQQECQFNNGMRTGQLIAYHPNGQIGLKATFIDDELDGTYEVFDKTGKLQTKEVWDKGKMVSSE